MKSYPCLKTSLPSDRRANLLDFVRPLGPLLLTIVLFATPVFADTIVLSLDEETIPAGILCGEIWNEAGLDLTVLPTDPDSCGLELCDFSSNPYHLSLFPGFLIVDLNGIAGTVNSAVVIAGGFVGICSRAAFYNGTTIVHSAIGACASVDTLEVFASGMPVDRLVLEVCYQSDVYEIRIEFDPTTTGVGPTVHTQAVPLEARPNPFNPTTLISFALEIGGLVQLRIYDVSGRAVRSLFDAELPAGRRTAEWDGRDTSGRPLASGTYFARLVVNGRIAASRKVMILK